MHAYLPNSSNSWYSSVNLVQIVNAILVKGMGCAVGMLSQDPHGRQRQYRPSRPEGASQNWANHTQIQQYDRARRILRQRLRSKPNFLNAFSWIIPELYFVFPAILTILTCGFLSQFGSAAFCVHFHIYREWPSEAVRFSAAFKHCTAP